MRSLWLRPKPRRPKRWPSCASWRTATVSPPTSSSRRRSLHMTQQQLADASGIRQSEISRIEGGNGNLTLKTIGALAHALGAEIHLTAG